MKTQRHVNLYLRWIVPVNVEITVDRWRVAYALRHAIGDLNPVPIAKLLTFVSDSSDQRIVSALACYDSKAVFSLAAADLLKLIGNSILQAVADRHLVFGATARTDNNRRLSLEHVGLSELVDLL